MNIEVQYKDLIRKRLDEYYYDPGGGMYFDSAMGNIKRGDESGSGNRF